LSNQRRLIFTMSNFRSYLAHVAERHRRAGRALSSTRPPMV
jgi:hypothetical protein